MRGNLHNEFGSESQPRVLTGDASESRRDARYEPRKSVLTGFQQIYLGLNKDLM